MEQLPYPTRVQGEFAHWIGHGKVEVSIDMFYLNFRVLADWKQMAQTNLMFYHWLLFWRFTSSYYLFGAEDRLHTRWRADSIGVSQDRGGGGCRCWIQLWAWSRNHDRHIEACERRMQGKFRISNTQAWQDLCLSIYEIVWGQIKYDVAITLNCFHVMQ